jgi:hypothetical protein
MKSTTNRIELDWSKLVGFNQVKSAQTSQDKESLKEALNVRVGAKVGGKVPPPAESAL